MAHTHTDRQNDRHTDGHGDSMTDPAQRAESVKIQKIYDAGITKYVNYKIQRRQNLENTKRKGKKEKNLKQK